MVTRSHSVRIVIRCSPRVKEAWENVKKMIAKEIGKREGEITNEDTLSYLIQLYRERRQSRPRAIIFTADKNYIV